MVEPFLLSVSVICDLFILNYIWKVERYFSVMFYYAVFGHSWWNRAGCWSKTIPYIRSLRSWIILLDDYAIITGSIVGCCHWNVLEYDHIFRWLFFWSLIQESSFDFFYSLFEVKLLPFWTTRWNLWTVQHQKGLT